MSTRYVCAVTGHSPPFVFDIADAKLPECTRALVLDVLEHAAEYHHAKCGCNLKIGGRAWFSLTPLSDGEDADWDMSSTDPLAVNAVLDDLRPEPQDSTVYLVLSGEKAPSEDYLRLYREKTFVSYFVQNARAFTRAGGQPSLPPQNPASFATLCSMQGSTFVDKTGSLHAALSLLAASRVNIIRRPKGFGKTAFLSMFDAFFDPLSAHAHFPFTFTENMSRPIFRAHGRLLVFALDFADLDFKPTMGRDELEAECDRLMNAASKRFYLRYRDLLCVSEEETSRADFSPTFLHLIRWSKRQGWRLCFTIDNYTAPILNGPSCYHERSISRDIFARLYNLLSSGFISYGLIVGEDVPHASEWQGLPETFMDLSDEPELYDSIGFTLDEIAALGQAISTDLIAALPPRTPIGRYARRVYAAADIVAIARCAMDPDSQSGPAPSEVRTVKFKSPPPIVTVDPSVGVDPVEPVATQHEDDAADDDTIYDELVSAHFGPLCDDDDDEDDDLDAQAPEMTDGSSKGSDTSSDGPSSAPSSGGKDKVAIVPGDEPSSPLEGYDKKPWSQDRL